MKLSDDRVNHISHLIVDALAGDGRVEFRDVWNNVRLRIRRSIASVLREDEEIERGVAARMRSLKRNIPEGGPEWDVLFRQYYEEEVDKLRSIR